MIQNLITFKNKNKLQIALRFYLVNFFDLKQEKEQLLQAFREIDKDNNGIITKTELDDFISSNS